MPIQVDWDNPEKTIVRFIYTGKWTWDEFYEVITRANEMMDTVEKPVVSIIDQTASPYLPPNAALHIRNVIRMSMSHNNSGISIFLKADTVGKMMIDILSQTYPDIRDNTTWHFTQNIEDARKIANECVQRIHSALANDSTTSEGGETS